MSNAKPMVAAREESKPAQASWQSFKKRHKLADNVQATNAQEGLAQAVNGVNEGAYVMASDQYRAATKAFKQAIVAGKDQLAAAEKERKRVAGVKAEKERKAREVRRKRAAEEKRKAKEKSMQKLVNNFDARFLPWDPKDAFIITERAAAKGNAEAIYTLGSHYFRGAGVKSDINKAQSLKQEAANKGYFVASCSLASNYHGSNYLGRKDLGLWTRWKATCLDQVKHYPVQAFSWKEIWSVWDSNGELDMTLYNNQIVDTSLYWQVNNLLPSLDAVEQLDAYTYLLGKLGTYAIYSEANLYDIRSRLTGSLADLDQERKTIEQGRIAVMEEFLAQKDPVFRHYIGRYLNSQRREKQVVALPPKLSEVRNDYRRSLEGSAEQGDEAAILAIFDNLVERGQKEKALRLVISSAEQGSVMSMQKLTEIYDTEKVDIFIDGEMKETIVGAVSKTHIEEKLKSYL